MAEANRPVQYYQYESGQWETIDSEVIVESPVSLTVNGEVWLAFMCTPSDLEAMAVGFLFNEGLIQSRQEIASVRVCPTQDNVDVWLHHSVEKPTNWRRTSGCTGGVTGVSEEKAAGQNAGAHLYNGACLSPEQISNLIGQLFDAQDLYRRSGGVHTSAISDGQRLWVVAEDIGRHNTLDKIAGHCLLEDIQLSRRVLLTTGRISSEMLQKAARLGAAVVISRTSPSSLSIELAEKWGVTLIGYARRNRFNVYAHPERILSPLSSADCLEDSHEKSAVTPL
jgi:FdhD protein